MARPMRWLFGSLTLILTILLSACQSTPTAVFDYDESINFGAYKSFAWIEPQPLRFHSSATHFSPLLERRLMDAARVQLERRGLQYVDDPAKADTLVAFTVGSRTSIVSDGYPGGYANTISGDESQRLYWSDSSQLLGKFAEGQVCVDLFDRRQGRPVWHGTVRESINIDEVSFPAEMVDRIMTLIMAGLPAGNRL